MADALSGYVSARLKWPESMTGDSSAMSRLDSEIAEGEAHLARLLDLPDGFDWSADGSADERSLLAYHVLYDESDAGDEFEANFVDRIQQARERHFVHDLNAAANAS